MFDLLLRYAVSEDGRLHAEKYYRTVTEEFATTRPAFRWRQLTALARVTASEYGYTAGDKRDGKDGTGHQGTKRPAAFSRSEWLSRGFERGRGLGHGRTRCYTGLRRRRVIA